MKNYPYVAIDDDSQSEEKRVVLRKKAQEVIFYKDKNGKLKMSEGDATIVKILEKKYDNENNCAGLAAPQIGFSKRIIIFAAPDDAELKKHRKDLIQTMPKTIWINPTYENAEEGTHKDFEACFSVNNTCGFVDRYKKIKYKAFLPDGTMVTGIATGFLARIIQHEIDHLDGILCIDKMKKGEKFTKEEWKKKKAELITNIK